MAWVDISRRGAVARFRAASMLLALGAMAASGCSGSADQERRGEFSSPEGLPRAVLPDSRAQAPIAILMEGLGQAVNEAARGLADGRRAHAMKAADEAVRVGEVALFAVTGDA